MDTFDFLTRNNADYIERIYQQYKRDPASLDSQWTSFFEEIDFGNGRLTDAMEAVKMTENGDQDSATLPVKGIYSLVHAYRQNGHHIADLDPLDHNLTSHPLLDPKIFGIAKEDMSLQVGNAGFVGRTDGTLGDLLEKLKSTYCGTFAVEFTRISDKNQLDWLKKRMEPVYNKPALSREERLRILTSLTKAEKFEQFLHTKYLGKKRFSVEGGDALLPLLDTIIETGSLYRIEELVIGMAHRGRLNVLANTMQKPYAVIMNEFEESPLIRDALGDGDVKYHQGYSYDHVTATGKKLHLSLCPNPSHLELVNPVLQGIIRSKQDARSDRERKAVVPVLIHGEAAFTGQGIVTETLNLSQLGGYMVGGTIHIILNNQLGYTATKKQTRFTPYPTDVGKIIEAPIFHVNADDPEAVVHAAKMAIEYRQQFKSDVMIDMWCYRRYGHNEGDDPTFTQPLMYKEINEHPRVRELYAKRLVEEDVMTEAEVENIENDIQDQLEQAFTVAKTSQPKIKAPAFAGVWKDFASESDGSVVDTSLDAAVVKKLSARLHDIPAGFSIHPKLKRLVDGRKDMLSGKLPIDWGCGESLAFGSLLLEGTPVRLAGQDSERGTFSHRHAVWNDIENGERYLPLANLDKDQGKFRILNTMLSELAVLGFEYGVSSANPFKLVCWEAQFGDFVNGAQAIIDEFIASGQSKWRRHNGIVLLLPHGYEGQGPNHSSARMERFLQLCAKDNMRVCYPSTPSQYFHLLRLQVKNSFRRPLILMMPKSLLRNKRSASSLAKFTKGQFRRVIDDASVTDTKSVKRLVLCTGKLYYDLLVEKEKRNIKGLALVRVEQLYPFPELEIKKVLSRYKEAKNIFWAQEEPQNMGAWTYIEPRIRPLLKQGMEIEYHGLHAMPSPADGYLKEHYSDHNKVIESTFKGLK